ncbi:MAG: hypothetical protein M4579_002044 [Chaenotheca gracillima]|nr:MAG: hypothetical protein M4579_002044 [Chaenotheca gracillima]
MMPLVLRDMWISIFLGNLLYLIAFSYYSVITFLGYNALPSIQHTHLLLAPIPVFGILFIISLFGFNVATHVLPILLLGTGAK